MRIMTLWNVTQSAAWAWWADNCMRLSASLAFYTALSLAPLVIIVVGLVGLVTERQLVDRPYPTLRLVTSVVIPHNKVKE